jgi:group I intron endonuclease
MGRIYIAKNIINGKGYIGQTIRAIKKRLKEHQKSSGCRAFSGAIKKYGWENFQIDWYECPDNELNKHERWMVKLMGTLSPGGYNLREGGGAHGKMSEETKQKLSGENNHNYGKPMSKEAKQKNREAHLGKKSSMCGKYHPMYGKTHSKETIQKMSGENNPMYGKTGDKHPNSKSVYQYDLDGTFINSFGSTEEAAQYIKGDGASGTHIRACARGVKKYKTAYKFKWSYDLTIFM